MNQLFEDSVPAAHPAVWISTGNEVPTPENILGTLAISEAGVFLKGEKATVDTVSQAIIGGFVALLRIGTGNPCIDMISALQCCGNCASCRSCAESISNYNIEKPHVCDLWVPLPNDQAQGAGMEFEYPYNKRVAMPDRYAGLTIAGAQE